MSRLFKTSINGAKIVIAKTGDTYTGRIFPTNKPFYEFSDENLDKLKAHLFNEAGKLHPDYFGMSGAIKRFRQFFPEGFQDPIYLK